MGKNILIMGHAYIVPANRRVWSILGKDNIVDLLIPKKWHSNLVGELSYKKRAEDEDLNDVWTLSTYFKGNGSFYFFHLIALFKVLMSKKYDLIVINQESWSLSLLFFNIIRLFTKNRKTLTELIVAQNIKKKKLRFLIPLEKFNLSFVTKVLGCCYETKEVYEWKGIDISWEYLPLYYNEKVIRYSKKYVESSDHIRLGYLGRLSKEKGIEDLLDAFSNLRKEHDIILVIAGDGPLRGLVESTDGVEYKGVLPHDEVSSFYNEIDLFILPSRTTRFWKEQFGRVIIESVMSGTLIAGSNSGAIPNVMKELEMDYVFEEKNSVLLAQVVEKFLKNNNKLKEEQINRAIDLCRQNFSEQVYAKRVIDYAFSN